MEELPLSFRAGSTTYMYIKEGQFELCNGGSTGLRFFVG